MKNKILLCLLAIVALFTMAGCGKDNKKESAASDEKDKHTYICIKKGVEQVNSVSKEKYVEDLKFTAELDKNDKKLLKYTMDFNFKYETEAICENNCKIKTDWNNDLNEKNYSGYKKITKCDCKKKTVREISKYDISNLNKYLRSDISEMSDGDTFDLDAWLSRYKAIKYTCN